MARPNNTAKPIVRLNDLTFDEWIGRHGPLTLVLVRSQHCTQSLELEALLEEAAHRYSGRVHFATVDLHESPDTMRKHDVDGVPTMLLFRGSEKADVCRSCGVNLATLDELVGQAEREAIGALV